MIRWWPPIAVTAMVVLGLVVGKGVDPDRRLVPSVPPQPRPDLLVLTDPSLLAVVMMAGIAVAFDSRRGRLAATAAVSPLVAWFLVQILKDVFGRRKDATLAYPSGHITLTVVIWGMVVLVAGAALWSVVTSIAVVVLAMLGQASRGTTSPTPSAGCCSAPRWFVSRR